MAVEQNATWMDLQLTTTQAGAALSGKRKHNSHESMMFQCHNLASKISQTFSDRQSTLPSLPSGNYNLGRHPRKPTTDQSLRTMLKGNFFFSAWQPLQTLAAQNRESQIAPFPESRAQKSRSEKQKKEPNQIESESPSESHPNKNASSDLGIARFQSHDTVVKYCGEIHLKFEISGVTLVWNFWG